MVTGRIGEDEIRAERRSRILEVALDLASRGGFDEVRMREVADLAHITVATLYRYFPSKIHLLVSALVQRFEEIDRLLETEPPAGEDAAARVIEMFDWITLSTRTNPHLTEALTRAFVFADATTRTEVDAAGTLLTRMLARAIQGDASTGEVVLTEGDYAIARILSAVWLSALIDWMTGRATPDQVMEQIETAVRLLLPADD